MSFPAQRSSCSICPAPNCLFSLHGDPDVGLSPQCDALLYQLISHRLPVPALSVWRPRLFQGKGTQLKSYNLPFRDLCDVSSFVDGYMASVFPTEPVFLTKEMESVARASWAWLMSAIDGLHNGERSRYARAFLHISRLGRATLVQVELYAFFQGQPALTEFLMVETPLVGGDQLLEKMKKCIALQQFYCSSELPYRLSRGQANRIEYHQECKQEPTQGSTTTPRRLDNQQASRCLECSGVCTRSQKRHASSQKGPYLLRHYRRQSREVGAACDTCNCHWEAKSRSSDN